MSFGSSKLGGASLDQREKLARSVQLLLLWVAASDGTLEDTELNFTSEQFPGPSADITTEDLLALIRNADLGALEKALRRVSAESREMRTAFLDLAITMSMADREIADSENHILRLYADALYLGTGVLEKRFQAITGIALTEPGDPGSVAWWSQSGRLQHGAEASGSTGPGRESD